MFCEPLIHGDDVVMAVKEIPPVTPLSMFIHIGVQDAHR